MPFDFDIDERIKRERDKDEIVPGVDVRTLKDHQADQSAVKDEAYLNDPSHREVGILTPLAKANQAGERVNVRVTVDELWEPTAAQQRAGIHQVGLLTDGSTRKRFTSWEADDPPTLEEGRKYEIAEAMVDEFRGRAELKIDGEAEVEEV